MTRPLPLLLLLLPFAANAQYFSNNFDGNNGYPELPLVIDTTGGSLWQVGPPQKAFFDTAYSAVNVIITDTIAPYPAGDTSSFTVKMPIEYFGLWPEFFINFQQSVDMDSLHAGGYIEISYDTGNTWMNVFEDWFNPPNVQIYKPGTGYIQPDTLSNGQLGFTGRSNDSLASHSWIWTSLCWVQNGIPVPDTLLLRFTFYSDSVAAPGDGWMLDEFELAVYIAHPISEYMKMHDYFVVAPNPVSDRLFINYDTREASTPVRVDLFDLEGRLMHTAVNTTVGAGRHNVLVQRSELPDATGMLLVRARIGEREHVERVLLGPADR